MNHTCLYSSAAEYHSTLAGTPFPSYEGRRLSWPRWLGEIPTWFARPKTVTHPSTSPGRLELNSQPSDAICTQDNDHAGDEKFGGCWPVIWNSLPAALRTATLSPLTFARHLKAHLFGWSAARLRTIDDTLYKSTHHHHHHHRDASPMPFHVSALLLFSHSETGWVFFYVPLNTTGHFGDFFLASRWARYLTYLE